MHDDDVAQVLAELARQLSGSPSEDATAGEVAQRALTAMADADSVSLTLRVRRGRFVTLAATDDLAAELDERQYALDQGPCVEAARGTDWCRSGDVGRDPRWPRWGAEAEARGVRSLLSISLRGDGSAFGALNLYSRTADAFATRDDVDFAVLYATHAALALSSSRQMRGLEAAVQSRHVIGAAQGILMERYGLDIERSFALLERYSSTTNTKLVELARDLVETGRLPSLPDPTTIPQHGSP